MKNIAKTLKAWFGRDTSSVVGAPLKRACKYSTLPVKGVSR